MICGRHVVNSQCLQTGDAAFHLCDFHLLAGAQDLEMV